MKQNFDKFMKRKYYTDHFFFERKPLDNRQNQILKKVKEN